MVNVHLHIEVHAMARADNRRRHCQPVQHLASLSPVLNDHSNQSFESNIQNLLEGTFNHMDDPIDSAFQSRRFTHGKSKGKSGRGSGRGGGGASKPFNPLAALGRYEVSLGARPSTPQHAFEIHELTESETGLVGTFDFDKLSGMFILAGSRKQLADIITGLEEDDDDDDGDEDEDVAGEDEDSQDEDDAESGNEPSAIELQDEKLNRRAQAFEKNSFRNPKFWMRWKGTPTTDDDQPNQIETDMGYLVFANNECDKFEGTITCSSLDWKQLKLKGRKVHSKGRSCPVFWNDLG
jgi:hypothetical protein